MKMKRISIKGIFYIALAAVVFFPIIAVLSVMDYREKIIRKKFEINLLEYAKKGGSK